MRYMYKGLSYPEHYQFNIAMGCYHLVPGKFYDIYGERHHRYIVSESLPCAIDIKKTGISEHLIDIYFATLDDVRDGKIDNVLNESSL